MDGEKEQKGIAGRIQGTQGRRRNLYDQKLKERKNASGMHSRLERKLEPI